MAAHDNMETYKVLEAQRIRHKPYEEFNDFWSSIPVTWHNNHRPQKRFMFDFLFRLIVTCWDDFTTAEQDIIKSEAQSYLQCSQGELSKIMEGWKRSLSLFSIDITKRREKCAAILQLFEELIACGDVCTEYTFDEGVFFTPHDISYPPEGAFKILKHMGYERGIAFESE